MLYPWDIIGHERQLMTLENEIANDNLTHAYLFHGPGDTGKFSIALTLAKILLCPNNLCHQCADCQQIKAGTHPDLILMKDDGANISIDDVRELARKTSLTTRGGRRIVLIEGLERMLPDAQNCFLKTLEEPASNTLFLMSSTQVRKILPTVISRSRQLAFFLADDQVMRRELSFRFKDHPDFEEVLQIAQGRPGLAIRLFTDSHALLSYKTVYYRIDQILSGNDLTEKFAYAESLEEDKEQMSLFFDIFCQVMRRSAYDFLARKATPISARYDLKGLVHLFEHLLKTRYLIERNANKKLALENFFLSTER